MTTRKTGRALVLLLVLSLLAVPLLAQAAPADVDPTFGTGGTAVTDIGIDDVLTSMSFTHDVDSRPLVSDPTIRAGGYTTCLGECTAAAKVPHWVMAGYTPAGKPDLAFSGDGIVREDGLVGEIRAVRTSGGTLAAGWTEWNGIETATIVGYTESGDHEGYFPPCRDHDPAPCRPGIWPFSPGLSETGARIPSVANAVGYFPTLMFAGAMGADNDRDFLVGVLGDGTRDLDPNFANNGVLRVDILGSYDEATTAVMQYGNDGIYGSTLLVGGFAWNGHDHDFALMRVNFDGSLDTSFGGDGIVATGVNRYGGDDGISALKFLPDGKILAAGNTCYPDSTVCYFALVRYNNDGTVDTSFGTGSVGNAGGGGTFNGFGANDRATAIAVTPDGNIYLAGYTSLNGDVDRMVARYLPNGTPDPNFGANGLLVSPLAGNDAATAIGLDKFGRLQRGLKVVVGGSITQNGEQDFALTRFLGDNTGEPEPAPTTTASPTPGPGPTAPVDRVESSISLDIAKTPERLKASGEVEPPHEGLMVKVTLFKRDSGDFVKVGDKDVALDEFSSYVAKFNHPKADRCRFKVRFEGDADHLPSSTHKTFDC